MSAQSHSRGKAKQVSKPAAKAARPVKSRAPRASESDLRFGRKNLVALAAALLCIVVGFGLLARGSITAAPLLLVAGYCVLVPYGLAAGRGAPTMEASPGE